MAENTQNITAQLAEAEQRVAQLKAQLAQANSNPVARKYEQQKARVDGMIDKVVGQPGEISSVSPAALAQMHQATRAAASAMGGASVPAGSLNTPQGRMASDMHMRANNIDAFVANDRATADAARARTQEALRMRLRQFANPEASPMLLDMMRRGAY